MTSFFLIAFTTTHGVRQIDPLVVEAAVHYGARGRRLFTAVLLPGALPFIFTGLRLGLGYALIVVVAVEIVAASRGLGALLWLSWQVLKVEDMYATFFVIAALGAVLSYGLAALRGAPPAVGAGRGGALMALAVPLGLLALWELLARLAVLSPRYFPPPTRVGAVLVDSFAEGDLGGETLVTLTRLALAFVLAAVPAVPLGPPDGDGQAGARRRRALRRRAVPGAEDRAAAFPADPARRGGAGLRAHRSHLGVLSDHHQHAGRRADHGPAAAGRRAELRGPWCASVRAR